MKSNVVLDTWVTELRRLEEPITKSDGDGVRARWESGRYLLTLRRPKRLPHGLLDDLADTIGVARSELGDRMRFAEKYATEEKLSMALERFGPSWSAIRENALTVKPREKKRQSTEPSKSVATEAAKVGTEPEFATPVPGDQPPDSDPTTQPKRRRTALDRMLAASEDLDPDVHGDGDDAKVAAINGNFRRYVAAVRERQAKPKPVAVASLATAEAL